jgi:hypothetical protein
MPVRVLTTALAILVGVSTMTAHAQKAGPKTLTGAEAQKSPQAEARRKQIQKVVVDGDSAVLEAQTRQKGILDEVRLVKTKDGWKITKGR